MIRSIKFSIIRWMLESWFKEEMVPIHDLSGRVMYYDFRFESRLYEKYKEDKK